MRSGSSPDAQHARVVEERKRFLRETPTDIFRPPFGSCSFQLAPGPPPGQGRVQADISNLSRQNRLHLPRANGEWRTAASRIGLLLAEPHFSPWTR
jgi:hypothetical protein